MSTLKRVNFLEAVEQTSWKAGGLLIVWPKDFQYFLTITNKTGGPVTLVVRGYLKRQSEPIVLNYAFFPENAVKREPKGGLDKDLGCIWESIIFNYETLILLRGNDPTFRLFVKGDSKKYNWLNPSIYLFSPSLKTGGMQALEKDQDDKTCFAKTFPQSLAYRLPDLFEQIVNAYEFNSLIGPYRPSEDEFGRIKTGMQLMCRQVWEAVPCECSVDLNGFT
jgi:hypothetical protein